MELVNQVSPLNSTVLIQGETGVGKEIIANAIHRLSPRRDNPFIKVNCGAIPDTLIDSELFGHEKGSFTGAVSQKRGRFERADNGTIFLDEIGELPPEAQVRLLRVMQTREIERVGGTISLPINIRVICATHQNLEELMREGTFREDLWFRINTFPIYIPPLRDRKEDISELVYYLINRKSMEMGIKTPVAITPAALDRLINYEWPGNVRELENMVERELIRNRSGSLLFDNLTTPMRKGKTVLNTGIPGDTDTLDGIMTKHITKVLKMTNGRVHGPEGAARILDINPHTLSKRMHKLGIAYGRKYKGAA
jgi:transcriptional regulator with GAF, ATPase, and Fis domain